MELDLNSLDRQTQISTRAILTGVLGAMDTLIKGACWDITTKVIGSILMGKACLL